MIYQRRVTLITLGVAVAVAAACSKPAPPPPPAPAPAPTVNQDSIDLARRRQMTADSIARAESMRRDRQRAIDDSIANARAMADAAARDAESMRATVAAPVHYDFDKADLRDDTKQLLDAKIPILTANSGVTIRIAGHTDDRGSGEYNLQLGQRRAAAARDYLTARGVNTARIELVSYGEERPVCQDKNEACWAQNRRAEFEITAGGNMLRKP
jgi:peptidoglycan-associated lipoprotein